MHLRPYTLTDKDACLAIFDGNTPLYFGIDERPDFVTFLDEPNCIYFVLENASGQVIGCGGYYINDKRRIAALCWGMVAREQHKRGAGQFMLTARLREICQSGNADRVMIDTSQHTAGFFQKAGFTVNAIVENAYAPGLHRYTMTLLLDKQYCQQLPMP